MTASLRGRVAIAALVAVLVFAAAFAVRKATAGTTKKASAPAALTLPATQVRVNVALPAGSVPALRRPPHVSAPASSPSTPSAPSTPSTPSTTPSTSAPTPSSPSPSKSSSPSGGPVLVG